MIIRMRKGLDLRHVDNAIKFFEQMGFNVHAKNGEGPVVLAVVGCGSIPVSSPMPFGVEKREESNGFFLDHYKEFVEAWQYVALREAKKIPA